MNYLYFLQNLREGALSFLNPVLFLISEAGMIFAVMIPLVIFWGFDKKLGKKLLLAFGISQTITNFIKITACIYRPWILDSRLHVYEKAKGTATGYSFPSGHSTFAGCTFGGLAFEKRKNNFICIICMFFALAIPFARNWLGAHTFLDVVTGLCIGFLSFFAVSALIDKFESNGKLEIIFFVITVALLIFAVIFVKFKKYDKLFDLNGTLLVDPEKMKLDFYKMCGAYLSILIGFFIENKFVCYEVPLKKSVKISVVLIGFVLTLLMFFIVIPFIVKALPVAFNKFFKYFLTGIFAILIYPAVVKYYTKRLH